MSLSRLSSITKWWDIRSKPRSWLALLMGMQHNRRIQPWLFYLLIACLITLAFLVAGAIILLPTKWFHSQNILFFLAFVLAHVPLAALFMAAIFRTNQNMGLKVMGAYLGGMNAFIVGSLLISSTVNGSVPTWIVWIILFAIFVVGQYLGARLALKVAGILESKISMG